MLAEILIVAVIALGGWLFYSQASGGGASSALTGPLSYAQIAEYCETAGFDGDDLVTAVAIVFAESSGNPSAQGDYGDPIAGEYNAFGLFQINIGENPQYANDNLTDPQTNANDAYEIYSNSSSSFRAWSTYNGGQYQAFLNNAQAGVDSLG
jgi:hypothetical protein